MGPGEIQTDEPDLRHDENAGSIASSILEVRNDRRSLLRIQFTVEDLILDVVEIKDL